MKVVIIGLDNAGKTTTLYKLLNSRFLIFLGEFYLIYCLKINFLQSVMDAVVVTAPTIGSNVEEFLYNNIRFVMWDIGGQESSRSAWSTYYQNTQVVILVIDSTDKQRIDIVNNELRSICTHEVIF